MQGEDEKRNESGVLVTVTETPTEGTSPPVDPALDPTFLALCKRVADEGGTAEYRLGGGAHFPEPLGVALSDEEAAALQRFNATLEPGARFFLVPGPPVSAPRLVSELPAPVEGASPPTVGQSPTVEPGAFVHRSPTIEGRDPVVELELRRLKQRIRHQRRELRALHRVRELESIAARRGREIALGRMYDAPIGPLTQRLLRPPPLSARLADWFKRVAGWGAS